MSTLIDALKGLRDEMGTYDSAGGNRSPNEFQIGRNSATAYWEYKLSEIIAEHERSDTDTQAKCKCGKQAEANHTCPYRLEINDSAEMCNCCDKCRYECAMDI